MGLIFKKLDQVARGSGEDAMGRTISYLFAMHKAICRQVLTQRAILLLECLLFFERARYVVV